MQSRDCIGFYFGFLGAINFGTAKCIVAPISKKTGNGTSTAAAVDTK
jgi:hypothetical protein